MVFACWGVSKTKVNNCVPENTHNPAFCHKTNISGNIHVEAHDGYIVREPDIASHE